ncbi:hypothetical protein JQ633_00960 [Bradyrhizobium tropiciagri]|uniref:hypothetical protein n=1 Tax=Bradyrhizobium tropiciagri TaxID=312253 RepID=UPI001BA91EC7|nr:hypothetical protein [Bradyrhizobium tropiciagri]MBR0868910.1 hypothetical protein [Bradyrhizobium tropiciagri]
MENELRTNLLTCAALYAAKREIGLSTLGRLAAGDWRFFTNLPKDDKTFTARKYDEVLHWFSANWPSGSDWPADIDRPRVSEQQGVA